MTTGGSNDVSNALARMTNTAIGNDQDSLFKPYGSVATPHMLLLLVVLGDTPLQPTGNINVVRRVKAFSNTRLTSSFAWYTKEELPRSKAMEPKPLGFTAMVMLTGQVRTHGKLKSVGCFLFEQTGSLRHRGCDLSRRILSLPLPLPWPHIPRV